VEEHEKEYDNPSFQAGAHLSKQKAPKNFFGAFEIFYS
jgi:hypothetical protein